MINYIVLKTKWRKIIKQFKNKKKLLRCGHLRASMITHHELNSLKITVKTLRLSRINALRSIKNFIV